MAAIDGTGLGETGIDVPLRTGAAFAGRPTTQVATRASRQATTAAIKRNLVGTIKRPTLCCVVRSTLGLLPRLPARVAGQPGDHHVLPVRPIPGTAQDNVFNNDSCGQDKNGDGDVHLHLLSQTGSPRLPAPPTYTQSITRTTPRRIGQPGSLGTGQMGSFEPGQVTRHAQVPGEIGPLGAYSITTDTPMSAQL